MTFRRRLAPSVVVAAALLLVAPSAPGRQGNSAPPAPLSLAPSSSLEEARHLIALGRFTDAEAMLRRDLPSPPQPAQTHYLLAYTLLRESRPRESLAEYTVAAALLKPSAEDLRNVANAYALLPDYPDAERWMRQSLVMSPAAADSWYDLGRILFSQQRFADSLASFEHALSLLPGSSRIENNVGLALEGLNRSDAAIAAYRQAIAWQVAEAVPPPSPEQPLLNLGVALFRRGELPEAQQLLSQAESLAPRDAHIHEQLGHLYLQTGDLPAATRELRSALGIEPRNAALHFLLGQTYRRSGQQAEANEEFREASAISGQTSSPDTH